MVYKGNYTQQELTGLKAELASSPGKVVRLYQGFCNSDPAGKNYMGAWLVDFDSGRFPSDTNPIYNHSIQRMGASRSAQLPFARQGGLVPTADAER